AWCHHDYGAAEVRGIVARAVARIAHSQRYPAGAGEIDIETFGRLSALHHTGVGDLFSVHPDAEDHRGLTVLAFVIDADVGEKAQGGTREVDGEIRVGDER